MTNELKTESAESLRRKYAELQTELSGAYRVYSAARREMNTIENEMMEIVGRFMSMIEEARDD